MPLKQGKSRATIGSNIATEEDSGKRPDVAAAIAFNEARKSGYRDKRKRKRP